MGTRALVRAVGGCRVGIRWLGTISRVVDDGELAPPRAAEAAARVLEFGDPRAMLELVASCEPRALPLPLRERLLLDASADRLLEAVVGTRGDDRAVAGDRGALQCVEWLEALGWTWEPRHLPRLISRLSEVPGGGRAVMKFFGDWRRAQGHEAELRAGSSSSPAPNADTASSPPTPDRERDLERVHAGVVMSLGGDGLLHMAERVAAEAPRSPATLKALARARASNRDAAGALEAVRACPPAQLATDEELFAHLISSAADPGAADAVLAVMGEMRVPRGRAVTAALLELYGGLGARDRVGALVRGLWGETQEAPNPNPPAHLAGCSSEAVRALGRCGDAAAALDLFEALPTPGVRDQTEALRVEVDVRADLGAAWRRKRAMEQAGLAPPLDVYRALLSALARDENMLGFARVAAELESRALPWAPDMYDELLGALIGRGVAVAELARVHASGARLPTPCVSLLHAAWPLASSKFQREAPPDPLLPLPRESTKNRKIFTRRSDSGTFSGSLAHSLREHRLLRRSSRQRPRAARPSPRTST